MCIRDRCSRSPHPPSGGSPGDRQYRLTLSLGHLLHADGQGGRGILQRGGGQDNVLHLAGGQVAAPEPGNLPACGVLRHKGGGSRDPVDPEKDLGGEGLGFQADLMGHRVGDALPVLQLYLINI